MINQRLLTIVYGIFRFIISSGIALNDPANYGLSAHRSNRFKDIVSYRSYFLIQAVLHHRLLDSWFKKHVINNLTVTISCGNGKSPSYLLGPLTKIS